MRLKRGVVFVVLAFLLVLPVFAFNPLSSFTSGFNVTGRLLDFSGFVDIAAKVPSGNWSVPGFSSLFYGSKSFSVLGLAGGFNITDVFAGDVLSGVSDSLGLKAPTILNPSALLGSGDVLSVFEPASLLEFSGDSAGYDVISGNGSSDVGLSRASLVNLSSFGFNASSLGFSSDLVLFRPAKIVSISFDRSMDIDDVISRVNVSDIAESFTLEEMLFRGGSLFSLKALGASGLDIGYSSSIVSDASAALGEIDPNAVGLLESVLLAPDVVDSLAKRVQDPISLVAQRKGSEVSVRIGDDAEMDVDFGPGVVQPSISLNLNLATAGMNSASYFRIPNFVWFVLFFLVVLLAVMLFFYAVRNYGRVFVWDLKNLHNMFFMWVERRRSLEEMDYLLSRVKFDDTRRLYSRVVRVLCNYMEKKASFDRARRKYAHLHGEMLTPWWKAQIGRIENALKKKRVDDKDLIRAIMLSKRIISKF